MKKKQNFSRRSNRWILLLSIALLLSYSATCKPQIVPVAIGEARIVGKILNGAAPVWEPKEDPAKSYFIVTTAYVMEHYSLMWTVKEQTAEIEKLRRLLEKK